MDGDAVRNLATAHRLRAAAVWMVDDLHAQRENNVSRLALKFEETDLIAEDRAAVFPRGVLVSSFRGETILQLIARNTDGQITAAVEAHTAHQRAFRGSDDGAWGVIRQIRTGVLLWNEHSNRPGAAFPRCYAPAGNSGAVRYQLSTHTDENAMGWTLRSSDRAAGDVEYPTFEDAILDIGNTVDPRVRVERERRIDRFRRALTIDGEWSAEMGLDI